MAGAGIWAETIMRTREACPDMSIEVLVGDFRGDEAALQMVIDAKPNILAHNLETVKRCHPAVRPSARYERTMELLRRVKAQGGVAKTGIMVGIGERTEEVTELFNDLVAMTADHDGPRDRNDASRGDPLRHHHDRAVPPAHTQPPADRSLGAPRRVRRL